MTREWKLTTDEVCTVLCALGTLEATARLTTKERALREHLIRDATQQPNHNSHTSTTTPLSRTPSEF